MKTWFIKASLLVGTLDIVAAFLFNFFYASVPPLRVLQFIASGVLGKESFVMGWKSAALGLLFHYFICFGFVVLFYVIHKAFLRRMSAYIYAIIMGIVSWCVMNLIVLPLSNVPVLPPNTTVIIANLLILVLCIGIPLSLMLKKRMA
jgi:DMSO reductase anchor subunit